MTFERLLHEAKAGDDEAIMTLVEMYKPMLMKHSMIDGRLDEDLYQELCIILMRAIKLFRI